MPAIHTRAATIAAIAAANGVSETTVQIEIDRVTPVEIQAFVIREVPSPPSERLFLDPTTRHPKYQAQPKRFKRSK